MTALEMAELKREIKVEIARAMNILCNGQTRNADANTEGIDNLFPGYPSIPSRPSVKPFGFHSLAPNGMLNLSARVGDHPANRYVLGHRDGNRPDLNTGETVLYNQFGQQIRLENGVIKIGSPEASVENFVLGQVFKTMMDTLLTLLSTHTHVGNLGYPTSPPVEATQFVAIKTSPIDDEAILSDLIFGEKG